MVIQYLWTIVVFATCGRQTAGCGCIFGRSVAVPGFHNKTMLNNIINYVLLTK